VRSTTKTDSSQNVNWAVDETASTLPSGDCVFVDKVVRQSLTSLHSSLSPGKPFSKNICKKNTIIFLLAFGIITIQGFRLIYYNSYFECKQQNP